MAEEEAPTIEMEEAKPGVRLRLKGEWSWSKRVPAFSELRPDLEASEGPVHVEAGAVEKVDSTLLAFLLATHEWAESTGREIRWEALPLRSRRLLKQALDRPPQDEEVRQAGEACGFLEKLGRGTVACWTAFYDFARFTGECTDGLLRLLAGKTQMRRSEFFLALQRVSVEALPIVALISFLVGLIISFLGAVTLREFGAEFAVAYLVGYGMLREMGAIMTGVIMAGRTGAAFAAEIASMKVSEELDALRTFGISTIDYVVLPRLLALVLMMPLLTAFANVIGIFGGWLVADFLMGVPGGVFFGELNYATGPNDLFLGLFKGTVFGLLIGMAGCLRGLQSGSGASAVGVAATRAVVTSITLIIVATAIIDWAAATLGI